MSGSTPIRTECRWLEIQDLIIIDGNGEEIMNMQHKRIF